MPGAEQAIAFGPFRLLPERCLLLEGDQSLLLGGGTQSNESHFNRVFSRVEGVIPAKWQSRIDARSHLWRGESAR